MAKIRDIIGAKIVNITVSESGIAILMEKDGRKLSLVAIADVVLDAEWDDCHVSFLVDVQEQPEE